MKLRTQILVFLLVFGLAPLVLSVAINFPLVLERTTMFYQRAYLQNLRADFRDLDQHLASRHETIRLLAKLPEPSLVLGEQGDDDQIDRARARYTGWVNQILADQRDIIQILFVDAGGQEAFWLERDGATLRWHPTAEVPERPGAPLLDAALRMTPGGVIVSRIRIDAVAGSEDPRKLMTLGLVSGIGGARGETVGLVVMTIDLGGLAEFYRDTLWVNNNGSYLRPGQPISDEPEAFADFPGLGDIFAEGNLALWTGKRGGPLLWVPMFLTEDSVPLWVGRRVDPSPIEEFRNALMLRVVMVVLLLILAVMIMARFIAARAERFGQELTKGIGGVLREGQGIRFAWKGPREVQELGEQLTALADTHVEHLRTEREHTRELERSNRFKSEFLANVSHELRTPLSSILLLSKMLADRQSGLSADQRRQAQVIHEAGRDLRTMIDNILDISRIEAGHVTLDLEWIELRPLASELVELVSPQFSDKGLILSLETTPDAPERVYSDRDKLRQILKNFLANAAKFTDRGRVTLTIERRPNAACPVAISVADTGIGIPADKQEVIFEAFQQADGSTRRRYGGTGLGLSISRELAQTLGGRILVESQEGQGSRFTLMLPLELDASRPEEARLIREPGPAHTETEPPGENRAEETFAGHWVLLVERDVQGLVAEIALLESFGLRVLTAADLDEALETLQEEGPCSLLLLATPVSAEKTCDTIRFLHGGQRFPIILVGEEEAQRTQHLVACTDGFLAKPVERGELESLLVQTLGEPAAENRQRQTA